MIEFQTGMTCMPSPSSSLVDAASWILPGTPEDFGRWIDVVLMQKELGAGGRTKPSEGT